MKNNNEKQNTSVLSEGKGFSYHRMIFTYLICCIVGLLVIVTVFNGIIEEHDKQLTNEICTLISEKMDTSIQYISTTVDEMSTLISYCDNSSFEESYQNMKKCVAESSFISIGIVDNDGNLYATEAERYEFEKWGLTDIAMKSNDVTISEPYRSSMTGQLVFTMFSQLEWDGERRGAIFVTYPLDEIQNMANTESLNDQTEIWIMDGYSDNIIRCTGSGFLIGSWSNFKIEKQKIKNISDYEVWEACLRAGDYSRAVNYTTTDGINYTQVFKRIDFMPGWNIVVRIPSLSLSNTMQLFRWANVAFAAVIIIATCFLLIFTHRRETAEKKTFENLSTYDPLTKILNRRAFEKASAKFFETEKTPECSFIFFDVDYFKQVNDNYGHEVGDYILVTFAAALDSVFGDSGLVSRFGGDEFVVLVMFGSKQAAAAMVEQFAEKVKEIRIECDKDFQLHFSAGMAACPYDTDNLPELMKCADNALYKVKESGRNGWKWYSDK